MANFQMNHSFKWIVEQLKKIDSHFSLHCSALSPTELKGFSLNKSVLGYKNNNKSADVKLNVYPESVKAFFLGYLWSLKPLCLTEERKHR